MKTNYFYLIIYLISGTHLQAMQDSSSTSGSTGFNSDFALDEHSQADQAMAYFFSLLTYYINVVSVDHGPHADGFLRRNIKTNDESALKILFKIKADGVFIEPLCKYKRALVNNQHYAPVPYIFPQGEYASLMDEYIYLQPKELLNNPLWFKAIKSYFAGEIRVKFYSEYYQSEWQKDKIIREQLVTFPHIAAENHETQLAIRGVLAELWALSSQLDDLNLRYQHGFSASAEEKEEKASQYNQLWATLATCSFNSEDNRNNVLVFVKEIIKSTIGYYGCVGADNEGHFRVTVDQTKRSFSENQINGALLKILTLFANLGNIDKLTPLSVIPGLLNTDEARHEHPRKLREQQQREVRYDIPCGNTVIHLLRIEAGHRNLELPDYMKEHDHTLYLRIVSPESLNFQLPDGLLLEVPFAPFSEEDPISPLGDLHEKIQKNPYLVFIIDELYKHAFSKKMVEVSPDQIAARSCMIDITTLLSQWPIQIIEARRAHIKDVLEKRDGDGFPDTARLADSLFKIRLWCKEFYTIWRYHSITALFGDRLKEVRESTKPLRNSLYSRDEKALEQRINARRFHQEFKEIKKQLIMNKEYGALGIDHSL